MSAPHVLHVFATFTPAGPQVRTVDLMRGMGADYRHTVVSMDGRLGALELVPDELGVESRPAPGGLGAMRRLLRDESPDLLCTYNWGSFDAVVAARLAGRRAHVHHEDGWNADEVARRKTRRNVARRLALGRASKVVVPSALLAGVARREWGVKPERLALILNGVDLSRFTPAGRGRAEHRAELGIPRGALVVGAVGHLRPVKRYDRLLRAVAPLDGVHLILIGDGPERAALEALQPTSTPRGGGLHLVGHQTDLPPWYRAMDVLCVSSDSEQLPVTLLEAMACGLSACGTDVGDLASTLPEPEGLLVAPDGPEALTGVLRELLADPARRARLSAAGVERAASRYSLEAMVRAYREVYRAALS